MSMKYIVPALAAAGRAAAQCSAATTTVQNGGDASAIAQCRTFTGSVAIATDTSDTMDFSGQLEEITGSLIANNVTNIPTISSTSLQTIGDQFLLQGLIQLSTLSFPALTSVDTIDWEALPALQGLSFTEQVQQANTVNIQNTELSSLEGLNLAMVETLILVNNPFLSEVDMQLGNISQQLTVESNGRDLTLSFPNLMWANNMTIRNASEMTIPSLASVNGSVGFYACDFESLSAPNLTSVGLSLSFVSNEQLSNISMPELTKVGGAMNIENNTALEDISFPALQQIGGALDYYGNFSTVELPQINLVKGAFNMQSSTDIDDVCSHFSTLKGSNNVIRGKYFCKGDRADPQSSGHTGGGSNSGSSSSATPSSFATPMIAPTAGTFLGVVAALFGMF